MNRLIYTLITIILIFSRASYASSKQHIDQINSRQHQQQSNLNKQIKSQQLKPTNVRLEGSKYDNLDFPLNESPCFKINKITIVDYDPEYEAENEALLVKRKRAGKKAEKTADKKAEKKAEKSKFEWILKGIYQNNDFALPACIGSRGINVLLRRMQNYLIDEGYVTTRVVVSSQDLRSGELVFTVIAGKINHIQLRDLSESPYASQATLYFAMPVSDGDLLNLHSIREELRKAIDAYTNAKKEDKDKYREKVDEVINEIYGLQYIRTGLDLATGIMLGAPKTSAVKTAINSLNISLRWKTLRNSLKAPAVVDMNDNGKIYSNVSADSSYFDGIKLGGVRQNYGAICGGDNHRCLTDSNGKLYENDKRQYVFIGDDYYKTFNDLLTKGENPTTKENPTKELIGATGGFQGAFGSMFGIKYKLGSAFEKAVENYAGDHDVIGGELFFYDPYGVKFP